MKTPVNRRTLKQHLTYNWWKYLLLLVIGVFGVDLLYTVTAPRIPDDRKVDFYIYGNVDLEKLTEYTEKVRLEEMTNLETIQIVTLYMDDQYGPMQLMTYIAAGEGENHLYGIPQDKLPGLINYIYCENGFLCVLHSSKNEENAKTFLNILCRDTLQAAVSEAAGE